MEELKPENVPAAAPEAPEVKQPSEWGRFFLDMLETILLAVVLFLAINAVSARVRVDGFSMRPTLENGEYVLVNKLAYRLGEPKRGDIIVFRFPLDPKQDLIKRVIGLPGDEIAIKNKQVMVNGNLIDEPYIAAEPEYSGKWTVAPGKLFVLGDNRNDSSDSHAWGLLPQENIVGKAVLIYWPPPQWSVIDHTNIAIAMP